MKKLYPIAGDQQCDQLPWDVARVRGWRERAVVCGVGSGTPRLLCSPRRLLIRFRQAGVFESASSLHLGNAPGQLQ